MTRELTAEDQVRAMCQLMGFDVTVRVGLVCPIRIYANSVVYGDDDYAVGTPADHFVYKTWDRAWECLPTIRCHA